MPRNVPEVVVYDIEELDADLVGSITLDDVLKCPDDPFFEKERALQYLPLATEILNNRCVAPNNRKRADARDIILSIKAALGECLARHPLAADQQSMSPTVPNARSRSALQQAVAARRAQEENLYSSSRPPSLSQEPAKLRAPCDARQMADQEQAEEHSGFDPAVRKPTPRIRLTIRNPDRDAEQPKTAKEQSSPTDDASDDSSLTSLESVHEDAGSHIQPGSEDCHGKETFRPRGG